MILAIDIGNTTITLAMVGKRQVRRVKRVDGRVSAKKLKENIKMALEDLRSSVSAKTVGVCCSVVPKLTSMVKALVHAIFHIDLKIVGRDVEVLIRNKYRNPQQVGSDRLVGAYAAVTLYGAPAIIIDLGTAVTVDVVSPEGHYEGGIILPGMKMSAASLNQQTALLPDIHTIKAPRHLIGKTTEESILSGLFYGYGAMCQGLVTQIQQVWKCSAMVVLTGGHASTMRRFMGTHNFMVDANLVLRGLAILGRLHDES